MQRNSIKFFNLYSNYFPKPYFAITIILCMFAKMKTLCLILSIYTLYMISLPCRDNMGCADNHHHNTEQNSSHNDDDDCHECSPFCTCNCCHVSTVLTFQVFFKSINFLFQEIETIHKESSLKEVFIPIFQPPQI